MIRIGNCAGSSGDRVDAPGPVVDTLVAAGGPAAVFFETLGERTVALAQLERRRDPSRGYEPMLERLVGPILGRCARAGIPILGNFGAANPPAAAAVIARLAEAAGLSDLRIAVIGGDDVRDVLDLDALQVHEADGGMQEAGAARLIAANAYIGAGPMVEALAAGAQVVVAGRVADPALALAPLMHRFGWAADDWDGLAAGAMAGHLLECGSQVTGGVFYDPGFKDVPDPANLGFPIAEVAADGTMVITKAANTGGLVDLRTVREQLLYELHDPAAYITPDVLLDVTGVAIAQVGTDRVSVRGARGTPAPAMLKVTACYEGGFLGEGEVTVAGPNCLARARMAADVLRQRMVIRGLDVRVRVDLIGVASVHDSDDGALGRDYTGGGTIPGRHYTGAALYRGGTIPGRHYTGAALYRGGTIPGRHYTGAALYRGGTNGGAGPAGGGGAYAGRRGPGGARGAGVALLRPGRNGRRALERYAAHPHPQLPGAALGGADHGRHRHGPAVGAGEGDMMNVQLHAIAHSRAGDKGNRVNLSLFPYDPAHYKALADQVTAERVLALFRHRGATAARRYDLPNLCGFNFVIDDALEGGVNGALNQDGHGKTHSFRLLMLEVEV